jgi:hypothetical protein
MMKYIACQIIPFDIHHSLFDIRHFLYLQSGLKYTY